MLRKTVYPKIEGYLKLAVKPLADNGITPNQLTLAGLALNFVAGYLYASGNFMGGALMLLVAGMGDLLDGLLARETGKVSKFGAFLDSSCDRYSDFFLFGGLALHYAYFDEAVNLVLCLGIIAGSYAVSYTKARAENFIENCGIGIFDRAVRLIVLFWGTFIPALAPLALWVLFFGSNATAVQRILHTKKALETPNEPAA